jgi:hypothetical protein
MRSLSVSLVSEVSKSWLRVREMECKSDKVDRVDKHE